MSIFEVIEESSSPSNNKLGGRPPTKDEKMWISLGVEFSQAKKKGITAKQFAETKGIKYSTFTKSMSRYAGKIKLALKIIDIQKKPANKHTKKEKELLLINSFRTSIRNKIKNEGAAVNNKSAKWFTNTIKQNVRGHKVTRPEVGKLYAYVYNAKHKETLPYWDKFPLIVYLGLGKQGNTTLMYGLNLHYIPPKARQQFLEELLKNYSNTPLISNKTRLKINWGSVKGFVGADKMIKAYLPGNIVGTFTEIKPSDWANVVMLPLQNFQSKGSKYSATAVWRS